MKIEDREKLNQLISRTDMSGNKKVNWLVQFIKEATQAKGGSGEEIEQLERKVAGLEIMKNYQKRVMQRWIKEFGITPNAVCLDDFPPVTPQEDTVGDAMARKGYVPKDTPPVTPQDAGSLKTGGYCPACLHSTGKCSCGVDKPTPSTHSEEEEEIVHILKPKYLSKDGTIKDGFQVDNKWYAPKNDLTHSEVGENSLINWLNSKVQSLNKSSSFYGYVNNVYKDQFEKEFSEWINEYLTPTKPVVDVNHLAHTLKNVLKGNDGFKVEFGNQEDNMNFILDICNEFKQQLINESYV